MKEVSIKEVFEAYIASPPRNATSYQLSLLEKNKSDLYYNKSIKICGWVNNVKKDAIYLFAHSLTGGVSKTLEGSGYTGKLAFSFEIKTLLLKTPDLNTISKGDYLEVFGVIQNIISKNKIEDFFSLNMIVNAITIKKVNNDWLTNDALGISPYVSQAQKDVIKMEQEAKVKNLFEQRKFGIHFSLIGIGCVLVGCWFYNDWYRFITFSFIGFGVLFLFSGLLMILSRSNS